MKRLHRLGSLAFLTITISFMFHILAMSFNRWIDYKCLNCNQSQILQRWFSSLTKRCYLANVASTFFDENEANLTEYQNNFQTEVCIPNEYLVAKQVEYSSECLLSAINSPHIICSIGRFNQQHCKCDRSVRSKVVLSMTILAALSLAVMVMFSHIISAMRYDYILKWFLPLSFVLLSLSISFIVVALATTGAFLRQDLNQLVFHSDLIANSFENGTLSIFWQDYIQQQSKNVYRVRVSWCVGFEIVALQFSICALVLYGLMFLAKNRPESED